jgi:hypothetical protein
MSNQASAIELPLRPAGWRPLLRAASFTGAAAVAGAALSVIATKIFAAMLGPSEVAMLATLQQIRQAGVTAATLNGSTALVQGASARSGRERREFLRTALLLMGIATTLTVGLALAAPAWVAASTGLGAERSGIIRWMAAPVMFSCALVFLSAVLNAHGAIGRLALVQIASPAAMAILALVGSIRGGRGGAGPGPADPPTDRGLVSRSRTVVERSSGVGIPGCVGLHAGGRRGGIVGITGGACPDLASTRVRGGRAVRRGLVH